MPSWHQRQAGTPQLWHETEWTVYTNARNNDHSGIYRTSSEADARAYAARVGGCEVIPPATVQRANLEKLRGSR